MNNKNGWGFYYSDIENSKLKFKREDIFLWRISQSTEGFNHIFDIKHRKSAKWNVLWNISQNYWPVIFTNVIL